jgi:hypothetical protein
MIEPLARLGYASKAFIYGLVGTLAAMAALQRGGGVTDTRGALRVVLTQPFGNAVLLLLAVGLCGYAVWRVLDALRDPDRRGTGFSALVVRIGNLVRALVYGGVGVEAFRLARGLRAAGGSDGNVRMWTSRIMSLPLGAWLVGLGGLVVAAYGVSQIVEAVKHSHDEDLDVSSIPAGNRNLLMKVCRFGVAARAVIIVIIGFFLVRAALRHDAGEAHGVRESVLEIAGFTQGRWLLGAMALGLIAYAVDQAVHARYRRIRSPI